MKTPDQIVDAVRKRVAAGWHVVITSETTAWPHNFVVGNVTQSQLESDFAAFQQSAFQWREWSVAHGLVLTSASRRVHGSTQSIPTHVTIPDIDTAIVLIGGDWPDRIQRGRARSTLLRNLFPGVTELAPVIRGVDSYSDTEFDLLCSTALWFRRHSASGLTPRQVPIAGLQSKWLNTHQALLQKLAGIDSLGLLGRHPNRIHFTYLDPDYLAAGGRRHDSATVGDAMRPAYAPDLVIISENKDSAIHFPALANAVSIEGAGSAGARAIASFDWIAAARHLIYWGDMDPAGLEILHQFRSAGLDVHTIFMDLPSFEAYERFGATADAHGDPLGLPQRKSLPLLTGPERELYTHLTDPNWTRVRRVEQERIPLGVAAEAVLGLVSTRLGPEAV